MSTWRRKALESFPQLRTELNSRDFNIYFLFTELEYMVRTAYDAGDQKTLARIFEYAHWCMIQRSSKEPRNAVCVAFYEHLFKDWSMHEEILQRLSPDIIQENWSWWEWILDADKVEILRKLIRERDKSLYNRLGLNRPTASHEAHREHKKHSDGREVLQKHGKHTRGPV